MSAAYRIPLTSGPHSFGIVLAGRALHFSLHWRAGGQGFAGAWLLDICEAEKTAPIVCGIALVTGCDLLAPYAHLNLGGALWVRSANEEPFNWSNLGGGEAELLFMPYEDNSYE